MNHPAVLPLAVLQLPDGVFFAYAVALVISGLILITLAAIPTGATAGNRTASSIIGALMVAYGIYVLFFQSGGTVFITWWVFVLPILMIVQTVKSRKETKQAQAQAQLAQAQYPQGQYPQAQGQYPQGQYPAQGQYPQPQYPAQAQYPQPQYPAQGQYPQAQGQYPQGQYPAQGQYPQPQYPAQPQFQQPAPSQQPSQGTTPVNPQQ